MKRLVACLLVLGGVALFVSGCNTTDAVPEQSAAENPATPPSAPKDHPAH